MRYGKTARLVELGMVQNDEGSMVENRVERLVFVNPYVIGATAWAASLSAGLHADAEVSLRTSDYHGEQTLLMDGQEYGIERVAAMGEFTRLTLAKRLSDVEVDDG